MRWSSGGKLRILDFDIECRPLSWYGGEWVTKEVTAIACKFIGERYPGTGPPRGGVWAIGEDDPERMLEEFVNFFYNEADMVTGHYIRGYDLPTLNAALIDFNLPPLREKMTQDTKLDLLTMSGISKSQENLASLLGIKAPKIQMDQAKWRSANRLEPEGIALTKERVVGDVKQHIEMRQALLDRGMLGPPKMWMPAGGNWARYSA